MTLACDPRELYIFMIGVRNWLQIIRIASELLLLKQKQHFLLHPTGELLTRFKRSYTLSAVPHFIKIAWQNVWAVCDSDLPCDWNVLWTRM